MVARNTLKKWIGAFGGAAFILAVGVISGTASAGLEHPDDTECLTRSFVDTGRVNDLVNDDPSDGPETGNSTYRIDLFQFDSAGSDRPRRS